MPLQRISSVGSVQLLSCVQLFVIPWTAAHQASLSITNSWSLFQLISITSVMPSNHLILCCPLLLPLSVFSSIRVFSSDLILHARWPKYWSFRFSISPSNEYSGLISFRMDCSPGDSQESSATPSRLSLSPYRSLPHIPATPLFPATHTLRIQGCQLYTTMLMGTSSK